MYVKFLFRSVLYLTQSHEIHTHTHTHTYTYTLKSSSSVIKNGIKVMESFWFIRIYYTMSCVCEVPQIIQYIKQCYPYISQKSRSYSTVTKLKSQPHYLVSGLSFSWYFSVISRNSVVIIKITLQPFPSSPFLVRITPAVLPF